MECLTTRVLMTTTRERPVRRWLAWRLATRPRPKREPLPGLMRPERETCPPAFCAAASACAMKGRARWIRDDRILPGRTRNSRSSAMAGHRNVLIMTKIQQVEIAPHIALMRCKVRMIRETPIKTIPRPRRNVRSFISP